MPLQNADLEQLWIDGWEALYAELAARPAALFDDEDSPLTPDEAQHRIQREAYARRQWRLERGWWQGRPALWLRFAPAEDPKC